MEYQKLTITTPTKRKGKMMIELQKGDYVATADIKDEAEYHAIARAFMEAGADSGEYPAPGQVYPIFGWRKSGNMLFHGYNNSGWGKRQLTPAQILVTPQWVPEVGERVEVKLSGDHWEPCEIAFVGGRIAVFVTDQDGEQALPFTASRFRPLPAEEDRAVEEMMGTADGFMNPEDIYRALYRAGYRKQPQPAEDNCVRWPEGIEWGAPQDSSIKCPEEEMALEHWVAFAAKVVKAETGSLYMDSTPQDVAHILCKAMQSGRMPRP